jgi:hypothetical protein
MYLQYLVSVDTCHKGILISRDLHFERLEGNGYGFMFEFSVADLASIACNYGVVGGRSMKQWVN